MRWKEQKGYSLIETIMALAITGIVAALAVPSYQVYMERSALRQVQLKLIALQTMQERFRLVNGTYAKIDELTPPEMEEYTVRVENVDLFTYTLIAERKGSQQQECSTLTIDHVSIRTPESCWD
ncbi:prepilin-type N-terminal cleavage/methylation domain-containing protein [Alteromonas ponticola]|uniref:Prepilin-type N-terminal cleavage/methylation domain-containing protein n=1 Tax=Alteromonas aquimaris TaxID=2998417 RepID=A0ABT3P3R9_9ALTE|nr:type IV pilin protein [Alteromonas aquimaris]MCW8107372.1 prepilin-type N-terminal cleavage/methylation domain-containing protein [Alteromonas aquimaris]